MSVSQLRRDEPHLEGVAHAHGLGAGSGLVEEGGVTHLHPCSDRQGKKVSVRARMCVIYIHFTINISS